MGGGGLWPILAQAHTSTLVRIVFPTHPAHMRLGISADCWSVKDGGHTGATIPPYQQQKSWNVTNHGKMTCSVSSLGWRVGICKVNTETLVFLKFQLDVISISRIFSRSSQVPVLSALARWAES